VQLLQEVVEVPLEPRGRVVARLRRNVQPRLRLHVQVFLLVRHVDVELVQLVALDDVDRELGLLLHIVRNVGQFHHLLQNFDH